MNLWNIGVQPVETGEKTRLRKFYERPPEEKPVVVASPDPEPAVVAPTANTLEAGSWEKSATPLVVEAKEPVPGDRRRGKRPYTRAGKNKIRRHSVSLSVSEEEENILRTHAVKLDMSFSEWARQVLFRALGRRLPSRGGGEE